MKAKAKPRLWRDRLKEDMRRPGFKRAFQEAREELALAEQIAQAREKAGLSQEMLGQAIGTTQSVISRIEHGGQNLTLAMLHKIAGALHRSVDIHLR
ncbi:MAG: helix-turn-helix domain-containing protein [Elusimicrobia bacterium]|nr:helix-turn-helix domain-containing protein [Elusimicrobiota bacterium]